MEARITFETSRFNKKNYVKKPISARRLNTQKSVREQISGGNIVPKMEDTSNKGKNSITRNNS